MAVLDQELQDKIDKLREEANTYYESKRSFYYQLLLDAWDKYPEPKDNWNEVYSLAEELFVSFLEDKKMYEAKFWLEKMFEINNNLQMDNENYLFSKGKYLFEIGNYEEAFGSWQIVVKEAGYRYFEDEDPKYLKYFRNPEKVNELPITKVSPANDEDRELTEDKEEMIMSLLEQGDTYLESRKYNEATEKYLAGLELIPSPKEEYDIALHLYVALGDSFFNLEDFVNANYYYNSALRAPGGLDNGYVWLGLGQSYYELQEKDKAKEALLGAYMLEGKELFEGESSKYLKLISDEIANK